MGQKDNKAKEYFSDIGMLVSLVEDGLIDETEAVKRSGLSAEEFLKYLNN